MHHCIIISGGHYIFSEREPKDQLMICWMPNIQRRCAPSRHFPRSFPAQTIDVCILKFLEEDMDMHHSRFDPNHCFLFDSTIDFPGTITGANEIILLRRSVGCESGRFPASGQTLVMAASKLNLEFPIHAKTDFDA